jgi:hypothetical protein
MAENETLAHVFLGVTPYHSGNTIGMHYDE